MLRRVYTPRLSPGKIQLEKSAAHHLRDVLRLSRGDEVEVFDDAGATAIGMISHCDPNSLIVDVLEINRPPQSGELIIASAIPKGERADWMVEKLSELGVTRLIPLIAARSVVSNPGKNKHARWTRIATESARQSRRAGVMRIGEPIDVKSFVTSMLDVGCSMFDVPQTQTSNIQHRTSNVEPKAVYLSTDPSGMPLIRAIGDDRNSLALFIGPEGGWADDEISLFDSLNLTPARLTATILRVETAAVAAAAIAASFMSKDKGDP